MILDADFGGVRLSIDDEGRITYGGLVGQLEGDLTDGTFTLGGQLGRIEGGALYYGGLVGFIADDVIHLGGIVSAGADGPTPPVNPFTTFQTVITAGDDGGGGNYRGYDPAVPMGSINSGGTSPMAALAQLVTEDIGGGDIMLLVTLARQTATEIPVTGAYSAFTVSGYGTFDPALADDSGISGGGQTTYWAYFIPGTVMAENSQHTLTCTAA